MKSSNRIADILLRRLDTLVNPQIENRVILGCFFAGLALLVIPRILPLVGLLELRTETVNILIRVSESVDIISTVIGAILLFTSCVLLYLFKLHKRPEVVVKSASQSARLWAQLSYSFCRDEYIHPTIIKDLIGWISDTGQQVVAINLADSNNSNRYHGDVQIREFEGKEFVEWSEGQESFSYEYLGTSESGIHVLHAVDCDGGSGRFHYLVLVVLELGTGLEYDDFPTLVEQPLIRMVGRISLGDRYGGRTKFERGVIRISKDEGPFGETMVDDNFSVVVR